MGKKAGTSRNAPSSFHWHPRPGSRYNFYVSPPSKPKTFGFVIKRSVPRATKLALEVADWLEKRKCKVVVCSESKIFLSKRPKTPSLTKEQLPTSCDMVIVFGGETDWEPFNATFPMPWSMETVFAFVVVHESVEEPPWPMFAGFAENVQDGPCVMTC